MEANDIGTISVKLIIISFLENIRTKVITFATLLLTFTYYGRVLAGRVSSTSPTIISFSKSQLEIFNFFLGDVIYKVLYWCPCDGYG